MASEIIDKDMPVSLVMRMAALTRIRPEPSLMEAESYADGLVKEWKQTKDLYREVVASAAGADPGEMEFDGQPDILSMRRSGWVEVHFPALTGRSHEGVKFNTKLKTEIITSEYEKRLTTKKLATKNWSTVGASYDRSGEPLIKLDFMPSADIVSIIPLYREIASASSGQALERMCAVKKAVSNGKKRMYSMGNLEIVTLGVKDKRLAHYLERMDDIEFARVPVDYLCYLLTGRPYIDDPNSDVSELLKDPKADGVISGYFNLLGLRGSMRNRIKREKDIYRVSSNASVCVKRGDTIPEVRRVLYFLRQKGGTIQLPGIGYDDSVDGELAPQSSRKVAHFIGMAV
jgi:hypothetical protein